MPRPRRSYAPGIPVHVVQRGVNRQACFFADEDRALYLETLGAMCWRFAVDLHAYVLMTNHVHLLMTPATTTGVSRLMQGLGRIYVRRVNDRIGRTGTLWEGRHRESLIATDRYLLACHRYIELNPVRAGMVRHPADYPWSSHRANASGESDGLLEPHPTYLGLSSDAPGRRKAYLRMFECDVDRDTEAFREGIRRRRSVGGAACSTADRAFQRCQSDEELITPTPFRSARVRRK